MGAQEDQLSLANCTYLAPRGVLATIGLEKRAHLQCLAPNEATCRSALHITLENNVDLYPYGGPKQLRLKLNFNLSRDVLFGDLILCCQSHKYYLPIWMG